MNHHKPWKEAAKARKQNAQSSEQEAAQNGKRNTLNSETEAQKKRENGALR